MCEMCVQGCELVVNQASLSKTTILDLKGTDADFTATFFFLLRSSVDKSVAIYDTVSDGGFFCFVFVFLWSGSFSNHSNTTAVSQEATKHPHCVLVCLCLCACTLFTERGNLA